MSGPIWYQQMSIEEWWNETLAAKLARFWIAKEIASNIIIEYHGTEEYYTFYHTARDLALRHRNYLTQIFKKEWFR